MIDEGGLHATPLPPGWDEAVRLDEDPATIPDPASVDVPDALRAAIEGHMAKYPDRHSAALPALGAGPDAYARVYGRLLGQARDKVILHWLGPMFDPGLAGYWGAGDVAQATELVLRIIADNAARVDGIKISLLDQAHEEAFRARLPDGVRLYTGDDFNYAPLIEGDGQRCRSRCYMIMTSLDDEGRTQHAGCCNYLDELVRVEGRWLFAKHTVIV